MAKKNRGKNRNKAKSGQKQVTFRRPSPTRIFIALVFIVLGALLWIQSSQSDNASEDALEEGGTTVRIRQAE